MNEPESFDDVARYIDSLTQRMLPNINAAMQKKQTQRQEKKQEPKQESRVPKKPERTAQEKFYVPNGYKCVSFNEPTIMKIDLAYAPGTLYLPDAQDITVLGNLLVVPASKEAKFSTPEDIVDKLAKSFRDINEELQYRQVSAHDLELTSRYGQLETQMILTVEERKIVSTGQVYIRKVGDKDSDATLLTLFNLAGKIRNNLRPYVT